MKLRRPPCNETVRCDLVDHVQLLLRPHIISVFARACEEGALNGAPKLIKPRPPHRDETFVPQAMLSSTSHYLRMWDSSVSGWLLPVFFVSGGQHTSPQFLQVAAPAVCCWCVSWCTDVHHDELVWDTSRELRLSQPGPQHMRIALQEISGIQNAVDSGWSSSCPTGLPYSVSYQAFVNLVWIIQA